MLLFMGRQSDSSSMDVGIAGQYKSCMGMNIWIPVIKR